MQRLIMAMLCVLIVSPSAWAAGIGGKVCYLGIALNQEGAAGGWVQVGAAGDWKPTIVATILHGNLYTIESSGCLYVTDPSTGKWRQIGNADFADTRFIIASGEYLYTIETSGNLYRVNPANGTWVQLGAPGDWGPTVVAVSLHGLMYTIETSGTLYATDLSSGHWVQVGRNNFANVKFLFASQNPLYMIDKDGGLYDINPRDGAVSRVGAAGAWKATIGGTMLGGDLYTVESDGRLYCTNVRTGERRGVGGADFGTTRFIFPLGPNLYTIEQSGNLYRTEAHSGRAIDAFDWCTDEIERLWQQRGVGLSHGLVSRKIVGDKASHAAILLGLDWLRQAKQNDLVILYLTAHGGTDPQKGWSILTAEHDTLWAREIKSALAKLPCPAIALIETCGCGGFAQTHTNDPALSSNVVALCACQANETTNNPLDIAVAEALYGRADFNHDGTIDLDELIKYLPARYKEWWPTGGEGSNTPVIFRGSRVASLALTNRSKQLAAVTVKADFWSALDLGHQGSQYDIHILGWSSNPGKSYYLTDGATRQQMCLETDGPPLLVQQNGAWFPARRLSTNGDSTQVHLLGDHTDDLTVNANQIRYPFVGSGD